MKVCGLLGGIAWTSSSYYYTHFNKIINKSLGSLNSSKIILYSLNLQEYSEYFKNKNFEGLNIYLLNIAIKIFETGADFLLICSNTCHVSFEYIMKRYKEIYQKDSCPILHISDCTAFVIKRDFPDIKRLGLLGTIFTMNSNHIKSRLERHAFEIITPEDESDRKIIMEIILKYEMNHIEDEDEFSKENLKKIILKMKEEMKLEGIILGCTELPLVIKDRYLENGFPVFNTAQIHVEVATDIQLGKSKIEDYLPSI